MKKPRLQKAVDKLHADSARRRLPRVLGLVAVVAAAGALALVVEPTVQRALELNLERSTPVPATLMPLPTALTRATAEPAPAVVARATLDTSIAHVLGLLLRFAPPSAK